MKLSDYRRYPAVFLPDGTGGFTVNVRGLDGAITEGGSEEEAREMAYWAILDYCLALARKREIIPAAPEPRAGDRIIEIPPNIAMKFMLRNVMSVRNYRPADLAKKMDLSTQVMAQVLDFRRKGTRFETLELAFSALGAKVEVEVALPSFTDSGIATMLKA